MNEAETRAELIVRLTTLRRSSDLATAPQEYGG
jgi:hypothetical protein